MILMILCCRYFILHLLYLNFFSSFFFFFIFFIFFWNSRPRTKRFVRGVLLLYKIQTISLNRVLNEWKSDDCPGNDLRVFFFVIIPWHDIDETPHNVPV